MALITQRETGFKKVLEDPQSFATSLLAVLIDEYSTDFFDWDPQALRMQVEEDLHAKTPDVNWDKIWALIVSLTTNQFFVNPEIFANTCRALSHIEADFSMFSPLDPADMSWAVMEVMLNNPPDKSLGNDEFSDEVAAYVGMMLAEHGMLQAPKTLQFAIYPTTNPVMDPELMFHDDEPMFRAALGNQKGLKDDVDQETKETLARLKSQLDTLPLSTKKK